jgi:RNA polymerase sigma-70 factor (ECF subfamily)
MNHPSKRIKRSRIGMSMKPNRSNKDRNQDDDQLTQWLQATAAGDRSAFQKLYQRTSGPLYGLCLRILKEEGRAQECVQDVFLAVWQQAGRFDPARAQPMTWLAAIAHHRAISLLRRFNREITTADWADFLALADAPLLSPEGHQGGSVDGDPHDWQLMDREAMTRCLEALRAEPRQAIHRAFWFGHTYQEIADELSTSLSTVKSWIRRALINLKSCLGLVN